MKEIRILVWCDGPHENVNVGDGVVSHEIQIDGGPVTTIDLCPACKVKFINPLRFLLDDKGVEVDLLKSKKSSKPNPPCPDCGHRAATRSALGTHMRKDHNKGLRDL